MLAALVGMFFYPVFSGGVVVVSACIAVYAIIAYCLACCGVEKERSLCVVAVGSLLPFSRLADEPLQYVLMETMLLIGNLGGMG